MNRLLAFSFLALAIYGCSSESKGEGDNVPVDTAQNWDEFTVDRVVGPDTSGPETCPGPKGTGEPCTSDFECASCQCLDVPYLTGGRFRICSNGCVNHKECEPEDVCLYPTLKVCAMGCSSLSDCPSQYNQCGMKTGVYKFCYVE